MLSSVLFSLDSPGLKRRFILEKAVEWAFCPAASMVTALRCQGLLGP